MFIVALVLFLGGFGLFGLAFAPFITMDLLRALSFAGGIIAVSLAMALPIHARSGGKMRH